MAFSITFPNLVHCQTVCKSLFEQSLFELRDAGARSGVLGSQWRAGRRPGAVASPSLARVRAGKFFSAWGWVVTGGAGKMTREDNGSHAQPLSTGGLGSERFQNFDELRVLRAELPDLG